MVELKWLLLRAVCALVVTSAPLNGADTLPEELDRADRRAELIGWEGVGRLDVRGVGTCSAALIAPDIVLTAAHCVVFDDNTPVAPKNILFRAGLRNGDYIAASKGVRLAVAPKYDIRTGVTAQSIRNDVALLQLASPIPNALAPAFQVHRGSKPRGELMVASYGEGRNEALSIQRECHVLKFKKDIYEFDCDITRGSSGAPIFAIDGVRPAIVSVVSAGNDITGLGMSLTDLVPALKRQLALGVAADEFKPAEVRRITVGGRVQVRGKLKIFAS